MKILQSNAVFFKPPLSEGVWGRLIGEANYGKI